MRLFTWYDVETEFKKNRKIWPESWNRVEVYYDEIVINVDNKLNKKEENQNILKNIFKKNYNGESILIEFDQKRIDVIYEEGDETDKTVPVKAPLFKDIYTGEEDKNKTELPVPIVAFHSYKGGVGRTLSLISLTREISEMYENKKKVLILDADMEAPGLTWMLSQGGENTPISYLDILSLMHLNELHDELAVNIAKLIEKSNITVETERLQIEQFFIPVYREKSQVMDIFSSPEKIIDAQKNKYIITEFLSKIGMTLGVDLILVDLRAGITEFSAPFLFDSRVQKFFVSSTSMQSVKGTQLVLDEINKKEPFGLQNSRILLTMIPNEMEEHTISHKEDELVENIESGFISDTKAALREDYLVRVFLIRLLFHWGIFRKSALC